MQIIFARAKKQENAALPEDEVFSFSPPPRASGRGGCGSPSAPGTRGARLGVAPTASGLCSSGILQRDGGTRAREGRVRKQARAVITFRCLGERRLLHSSVSRRELPPLPGFHQQVWPTGNTIQTQTGDSPFI